MQNDTRILIENLGEDSLVIVDLQLRIQATLEEDFDAAFVDRIANFRENLLVRKQVAFLVVRHSIEGTEFTSNPAHIRVIQYSADNVGDRIWIRLLHPAVIGQCGQFIEVGMTEEETGILLYSRLTVGSIGDD